MVEDDSDDEVNDDDDDDSSNTDYFYVCVYWSSYWWCRLDTTSTHHSPLHVLRLFSLALDDACSEICFVGFFSYMSFPLRCPKACLFYTVEPGDSMR